MWLSASNEVFLYYFVYNLLQFHLLFFSIQDLGRNQFFIPDVVGAFFIERYLYAKRDQNKI